MIFLLIWGLIVAWSGVKIACTRIDWFDVLARLIWHQYVVIFITLQAIWRRHCLSVEILSVVDFWSHGSGAFRFLCFWGQCFQCSLFMLAFFASITAWGRAFLFLQVLLCYIMFCVCVSCIGVCVEFESRALFYTLPSSSDAGREDPFWRSPKSFASKNWAQNKCALFGLTKTYALYPCTMWETL